MYVGVSTEIVNCIVKHTVNVNENTETYRKMSMKIQKNVKKMLIERKAFLTQCISYIVLNLNLNWPAGHS